jgi:hypothetical protein
MLKARPSAAIAAARELYPDSSGEIGTGVAVVSTRQVSPSAFAASLKARGADIEVRGKVTTAWFPDGSIAEMDEMLLKFALVTCSRSIRLL